MRAAAPINYRCLATDRARSLRTYSPTKTIPRPRPLSVYGRAPAASVGELGEGNGSFQIHQRSGAEPPAHIAHVTQSHPTHPPHPTSIHLTEFVECESVLGGRRSLVKNGGPKVADGAGLWDGWDGCPQAGYTARSWSTCDNNK